LTLFVALLAVAITAFVAGRVDMLTTERATVAWRTFSPGGSGWSPEFC